MTDSLDARIKRQRRDVRRLRERLKSLDRRALLHWLTAEQVLWRKRTQGELQNAEKALEELLAEKRKGDN
jgi:hypothetical protein